MGVDLEVGVSRYVFGDGAEGLMVSGRGRVCCSKHTLRMPQKEERPRAMYLSGVLVPPGLCCYCFSVGRCHGLGRMMLGFCQAEVRVVGDVRRLMK